MVDQRISRRTVLRAAGGTLSVAGLSGAAAAEQPKDKSYGEGTGIGAFLNEQAELKKPPVWDSGIANRLGEDVVDVAVGALTTAQIPDPEAPEMVRSRSLHRWSKYHPARRSAGRGSAIRTTFRFHTT